MLNKVKGSETSEALVHQLWECCGCWVMGIENVGDLGRSLSLSLGTVHPSAWAVRLIAVLREDLLPGQVWQAR